MLNSSVSIVPHMTRFCRHVHVIGRFVRLGVSFNATVLRVKLHMQLLEHQVVLRIFVINKFFKTVRNLFWSCFTAQRVFPLVLRIFWKDWVSKAWLVLLSISDFWSLAAWTLLLNKALSLAAEYTVLRFSSSVVIGRQAALLESLDMGTHHADIVKRILRWVNFRHGSCMEGRVFGRHRACSALWVQLRGWLDWWVVGGNVGAELLVGVHDLHLVALHRSVAVWQCHTTQVVLHVGRLIKETSDYFDVGRSSQLFWDCDCWRARAQIRLRSEECVYSLSDNWLSRLVISCPNDAYFLFWSLFVWNCSLLNKSWIVDWYLLLCFSLRASCQYRSVLIFCKLDITLLLLIPVHHVVQPCVVVRLICPLFGWW